MTMATKSSSMPQLRGKFDALTPQQITSIVLADGEHEVENCESIQFVVGEAHSPISLENGTYAYLRYNDKTNGGKLTFSPWSAVQAISDGSTDTASQRKPAVQS